MPPAGYFIDANLLVLLVVGNESRDLIGRHKRLQEYTAEDYDLLVAIAARADRLYVTPNVLTEASNLLGYHQEPERSRLYEQLRWLIEGSEELVVRSAVAASNGAYPRLGLTDAALLEVATADTPLITTDVILYIAAAEKDAEAAVNFNHHRGL